MLALGALATLGTTAAASAAEAAVKPLAGWKIAKRGAFTVAAGTQAQGVVGCPTGTVVGSGGAIVATGDLTVNVNSSYPSPGGHGWIVDVNNASPFLQGFWVYAVCLKRLPGYQIAVNPSQGLVPGQTNAEAGCPV